MTTIQEAALWVVAVAGGLGALYTLWRKLQTVWREGKKDGRAFRDAILGRDEITHPDTGAVLAPAVPGIGARMATIEEAVVKMADTHLRVDSLEIRVATLEQKDIERALARTETIEMYRTIDTAIKATPEDDR